MMELIKYAELLASELKFPKSVIREEQGIVTINVIAKSKKGFN